MLHWCASPKEVRVHPHRCLSLSLSHLRIAFLGIPPPMLRWFKDNNLIDESYSFGMDGTVWNELVINNLSPSHLNDKYVCQASNYNSSNIKQAFVVLDMNRTLSPSPPRLPIDYPACVLTLFSPFFSLSPSLLPYISDSFTSSHTL